MIRRQYQRFIGVMWLVFALQRRWNRAPEVAVGGGKPVTAAAQLRTTRLLRWMWK